MADSQNKFDSAIWKVVSSIGRGCVMGYGDVARAAGYPRHARLVSKAMSRSSESLPWHRVLRSDRTLAFKEGSDRYKKQRRLLEEEGVQFINSKAVPVYSDEDKTLDELLWKPK